MVEGHIMATFRPPSIVNNSIQRKDLPQGTVYLVGLDERPDNPTAAGQLIVATLDTDYSTFLYCSIESEPGVFRWVEVSLFGSNENPSDDEIWVTA